MDYEYYALHGKLSRKPNPPAGPHEGYGRSGKGARQEIPDRTRQTISGTPQRALPERTKQVIPVTPDEGTKQKGKGKLKGFLGIGGESKDKKGSSSTTTRPPPPLDKSAGDSRAARPPQGYPQAALGSSRGPTGSEDPTAAGAYWLRSRPGGGPIPPPSQTARDSRGRSDLQHGSARTPSRDHHRSRSRPREESKSRSQASIPPPLPPAPPGPEPAPLRPGAGDEGFLTLNVYGPYETTNQHQMEKISEYIIGLSMHLAGIDPRTVNLIAGEASRRSAAAATGEQAWLKKK